MSREAVIAAAARTVLGAHTERSGPELAALAAAPVLEGAPVQAVFVGLTDGARPAEARHAALAAGVGPRVPVTALVGGGDAGHAALQAAVSAVLSGYVDDVLVLAACDRPLAAEPAAPPASVAWRFAFPGERALADTHADRFALGRDALAEWVHACHARAAPGGVPDPGGTATDPPPLTVTVEALLDAGPFPGGRVPGPGLVAARTRGAAAVRVRGGGDGVRIASLAAVGVDPGSAPMAGVAAAEAALHKLQVGAGELSAVASGGRYAAEGPALREALALAGDRVDPRGGAFAAGHVGPAQSLCDLVSLLDVLASGGGRYALLASGGVDSGGLGRATLLDTARFA